MDERLLHHLEKARALIEKPENWGKGANWKPSNDSSRFEDGCFCLLGALAHATIGYGYPDGIGNFETSCNLIKLEIGEKHVSTWNDRPETKHADVLEVLDNVIEKVKNG